MVFWIFKSYKDKNRGALTPGRSDYDFKTTGNRSKSETTAVSQESQPVLHHRFSVLTKAVATVQGHPTPRSTTRSTHSAQYRISRFARKSLAESSNV